MLDTDFINSYSANQCQAGHVFVWAGDPDYPIPEGYLCNCGMTKAHWKICSHCGNRTLCAVPIEIKIDTELII